jgi:hypothetical protein
VQGENQESNSKVISITQEAKANYDVDILNIAIKRKDPKANSFVHSDRKQAINNPALKLKNAYKNNANKAIQDKCASAISYSPSNIESEVNKSKKVQSTQPGSKRPSGIQSPDAREKAVRPKKHVKTNSTQFTKINQFIQSIGKGKKPMETKTSMPSPSAKQNNTLVPAKLTVKNIDKMDLNNDMLEISKIIKDSIISKIISVCE